MTRLLILIYGLLAYGAFFGTILYMIGFVTGIIVPKAIDSGTPAPVVEAISVDLALVLLFGATHSVMARPGFKETVTKIISPAAERSTFVLVASLVLSLLHWQWRPIETIVWECPPPLSTVVFAASMLGWLIVFGSTFLIDHFDLFGLRQVWLNFKGVECTHRPFVVRGLYKYVRHPLMLGFLVAFWCAPTMTLGHLIFSVSMTVYILIGIYFEERDLSDALGESYKTYRSSTSMIIPWRT
jgi:protein-S-isoprenylcysteine O-methyltransferase Ste14